MVHAVSLPVDGQPYSGMNTHGVSPVLYSKIRYSSSGEFRKFRNHFFTAVVACSNILTLDLSGYCAYNSSECVSNTLLSVTLLAWPGGFRGKNVKDTPSQGFLFRYSPAIVDEVNVCDVNTGRGTSTKGSE